MQYSIHFSTIYINHVNILVNVILKSNQDYVCMFLAQFSPHVTVRLIFLQVRKSSWSPELLLFLSPTLPENAVLQLVKLHPLNIIVSASGFLNKH